MKLNYSLAAAASAVGLLIAGPANAASLNNGFDGSSNTSVFISLVERDAINLPVRTLVVNPDVRTLDVFGLTAWSTSDDVSSVILDFLTSAQGTVSFNIGGGLNDQSFSSDLYGFLTSSDTAGPAEDNFSQLGAGVTNIDAKIDNLNRALGGNATALVTSASDPGWHVFSWNNDVGGAILPSNEVKFGTVAALTGWKVNNTTEFLIIRNSLGTVFGDAATGRISFTPVPVPAAAWLLVSGFGALAWVRRRPLAA
jgi:hypothetical protein